MKTLILMRHAKSSWDSPLTDVERPLNARGQTGATALGKWLRSQALQPDSILCSYAVRTMETVERLALGVPYHPIRSLYLAPSELMYDHLLNASGETLLMVAHNPGTADLAHDLTNAPSGHDRFEDHPTGSTSVLTFDIARWADLKMGTGTLAHFVIPADLDS